LPEEIENSRRQAGWLGLAALVMSRVGLELTVHFWNYHYERSEESALVYGWTDTWQNSRSLTA